MKNALAFMKHLSLRGVFARAEAAFFVLFSPLCLTKFSPYSIMIW